MKCAGLAILALLVSVTAAAVEKAAPAERIRELAEQKAQVESALRAVESKQGHALAILDTIDRQRSRARATAQQARRDEATIATRVAALEAKIDRLHRAREALAQDLGARLLLRYRLRGGADLRLVLGGTSIGDALWRRRMLDKLLSGDLDAARRLADVESDEAAEAREVGQQQTLLATAEATAVQRGADADRKEAVERGVVGGLVARRSTIRRTLADIDAQRGALQHILDALPVPPKGLDGFAGLRGHLPWPVAGKVELKFGRHVDNKLHIVLRQKGYDIRADAGTPVVAPAPALVAFAGWFSGFGNLVILDHGEGYYSLYAHLRSLAVAKGQRVAEGAALGEVGDTGSLKGAYLYFEIRSGSKPLDPGEWLAKR